MNNTPLSSKLLRRGPAQRVVDETAHDLRVDHLQADVAQHERRQQGKAPSLRADVAR